MGARSALAGLGQQAVFGALGGLYGSGAMSVFRLAMHRAGLIDKMVPQAVEEWLSHKLAADPPGGKVGRQLTDQTLHLAYGTLCAAVAARALLGAGGRTRLWRGGAFGLALWLVGTGVVFPWLRIARPPWRARPGENVTNALAHLIYGVSVQLIAEELSAQKGRGRSTHRERERARVG